MSNKTKTHRYNIILDDKSHEIIRETAARTGLTFTMVITKALDLYSKEKNV